MAQTVMAVYENGILRPLEPLDGLTERSRVLVRVEDPPDARGHAADCVGVLPDEDAEEMRQIIEAEFEQVDPRDWQ